MGWLEGRGGRASYVLLFFSKSQKSKSSGRFFGTCGAELRIPFNVLQRRADVPFPPSFHHLRCRVRTGRALSQYGPALQLVHPREYSVIPPPEDFRVVCVVGDPLSLGRLGTGSGLCDLKLPLFAALSFLPVYFGSSLRNCSVVAVNDSLMRYAAEELHHIGAPSGLAK